jgi:hypothetical protein
MPANDNTPETQEDDAASAASANGSTSEGNDLAVWQSRLNGQTAKVGELTNANKALIAERETLLQQVADLQAGKVSADEAATARVKAAEEALARERNERRTDSLKARFPETFGVLGDAAFSLDEAALAANEARLLGDTGGEEPPTPLQHNAARTGASATRQAKEETAADVRARLEAMPLPEGWA